MTITVRVISDSINENGNRLTTLQLKYPRFIHAELITHRQFSRNASSSRAIPVETMIRNIRENPAIPIHWGKNQPGMQAREECDELVSTVDYGYEPKEEAWKHLMHKCCDMAESFSEAGYHKQIVNRLTEPFQHISVLVSATEYDNFFSLRCHPDAQPEIQLLATEMRIAMEDSIPELLNEDQWHLPYISNEEKLSFPYSYLIKLSVARCARVSYLTHDNKKPNLEDDIKLYERLVGSVPIHASPAEHQATPSLDGNANFVGWKQHRRFLEENNA